MHGTACDLSPLLATKGTNSRSQHTKRPNIPPCAFVLDRKIQSLILRLRIPERLPRPMPNTYQISPHSHVLLPLPPFPPQNSHSPANKPRKKKTHSRRKLPKLMPHHLLRDRHFIVDLPVVHLEPEPDEIGQDRRAARLRFDGGRALAWFRGHDGEAGGRDDGGQCLDDRGVFGRWE